MTKSGIAFHQYGHLLSHPITAQARLAITKIELMTEHCNAKVNLLHKNSEVIT